MVSKWSAGLFGRCTPTKWRRKELLSCSKLSIDDVGNLVNHSLAAPLRVVGKERHRILLGGCWRPCVVLNVLRWSNGSFSLSKGLSWDRRNLEGIEHSWTAKVKGESVFLTILSKLWSIFPLIVFLSSSISFLISLRRLSLPLLECWFISYDCLHHRLCWFPCSYLLVAAATSFLGFA